jgi:DNA-directed RNA polymerase specialized sigma24 family protein
VTAIPAPGRRGPRHALTISADEASGRIDQARQARDAVAAARAEAACAVERYRAAIRGVHAAGLSVRQIAAALEIPPSTVQDAIARPDSTCRQLP